MEKTHELRGSCALRIANNSIRVLRRALHAGAVPEQPPPGSFSSVFPCFPLGFCPARRRLGLPRGPAGGAPARAARPRALRESGGSWARERDGRDGKERIVKDRGKERAGRDGGKGAGCGASREGAES